MNNAQNQDPNQAQANNQEFHVDINNFSVLNHQQKGSPAPNASNGNPYTKDPNTGDDTQEAKVKNIEDDGNGFFITGINTHEQDNEVEDQMV